MFGTLSLFSPWNNRLNHLSKISRLFFGTISSPTLILILHAPFISFAPVDHALLYLYTMISLRLFDLSNRPSVTFCHCHLTVILYLPFVFVYCKAIIIIIIKNNIREHCVKKSQNSALHLYIRQQKVLRFRKQRVGIYIIIIILL